jgi:2-polyprenyl-6-hydroxyphenyl methylase/3-demethylubiquinone-9 3-methyltransferase
VGIDPYPDALRAARNHARDYQVIQQAHFEQAPAEQLPYADGSFSVIVCLDVLEHVQDVEATLREIARVLAPGGLFIFDTINRTLIARIALIWLSETFLGKKGALPGLHDYQHFIKPSELRLLLSKSGLCLRALTGFMPRMHEGRLTLGPGWFQGVSYSGYATKEP